MSTRQSTETRQGLEATKVTMTHPVVALDTPWAAALNEAEPDTRAAPTEALAALWTRQEFERRVKPWVPKLYRMCFVKSRDAAWSEDIVQNALIKAYIHRKSFRGQGSFGSWLYSITRREYQEATRVGARRRSLFETALESVQTWVKDWAATPAPTPEEWMLISCAAEEVWDALNEVPEPYRTLVLMCDLEELSYQEAAEALGIALGTAKSRHARGRKRLRQALEQRVSTRISTRISTQEVSHG